MDLKAKSELAHAIMDAIELREASYDSATQSYRIGWGDATERVCKDSDLQPLVCAMLASGFCEFVEWAEKFT